jgi:hypothetical protein
MIHEEVIMVANENAKGKAAARFPFVPLGAPPLDSRRVVTLRLVELAGQARRRA